MKVLLDARPLQDSTAGRGVGHYVRDLARGLRECAPEVELFLFLTSRGNPLPPEMLAASEGTRAIRMPPGPQLLWGHCLGPAWLRGAQCDLWHATFLAPPRVPRGQPWVATIHDLIPLRHPRGFSIRTRWGFGRSLRLAAQATRIVAVSRVTAGHLIRELGVDARRIEVVPPAVDLEPFARPAQGDEVRFSPPYLLHLGGFDPLKGVGDLLLPAFAKLSRTRPELSLVLTGAASTWRRSAERRAEELGIASCARFVGHLSEEARIAAIRGAAAVVVASKEEGFGLPVIEAFAAGVPVAVGPAMASREAAGGLAAVAVSGTSQGLAEAIDEALADGGPTSEAGARRRARAAVFAPREVARRMVEVYRRALGVA